MRKKLFLSLCSMLFTIIVIAQTTATGKVVDDKGAGIAGASVQEKGTKNGTTTGSDGSYSLKISKAGVKLTITSIGFESMTIDAGSGGKTTLKTSSDGISEVVVTALGINKSREKLGYSTTNFKADDVTRVAPVSALDGLQGKIAGADISTIGGQPGSSSKIVLRGFGSLTGSNQALIIVDGVPFNNDRLGSVNEGLDFGNGLNDLNPNDIESLNVLKGAAATAVYGTQASGGAIIITTKKGKAGKLKVDFVSSVIASSVGKLPTLQNQFGQGWGSLHWKEENGSWGPRLDGSKRLWGSEVDNSRLLKPFTAIDNNVRNFYETGTEFNNSISLRGGNETTTFYFSYGNVKSDGVIPGANDVYSRNTVSLKTQTEFSKLTIGGSFNYINKKARQASTDDSPEGSSTFENILQIPVDLPISDFRDYNNKFFNVDNYFTPYAANPYFSLFENGNNYNNDRFFGNIDFTYKFNERWNLKTRVGVDAANSRLKDYQAVERPKDGSWRGPNPTNAEGASYTAKTGGVYERSDYARTLNTDVFLNYNKTMNKDWDFDGFVGFNYFENQSRNHISQITNLTIPNFYQLSNSTNNPTTTSRTFESRRYGIFSNFNFSYKQMLYLSFGGRNDIFSTLPIDVRSFFYPSSNVSLLLHRALNITTKNINYLKVRAAYGKTGRDAAPYQLKSTLAPGIVGLGFGNIEFPLNGVSAFELGNTIGSTKLKPEVTTEAELGMEGKFLNNRLSVDVSIYERFTDGQIFAVPIAATSGYTGLISNFGKVKNSGIELSATYTPVLKKNLKWDVTFTYTKNFNRVISVPGDLDKVELRRPHYDVKMTARAGKPIGLIEAIVPQTTSTGQTIVNSTNGLAIPTTDDYIYGNINRDYMMGLVNSIAWKSFRFNLSLDYRVGGQFVSRTADLSNFVGNAYNTTYNDRRPFILPNSVVAAGNDPATGKPIYVENTKAVDMDHFYTYFYHTDNKAMAWRNRIMSKSFLKIRDISVSYNFSQSFAKKIKAENMSLTLIARNFLVWTPSQNQYVDPEATNLNNDLSGEFGEFATSPTTRSYGISLKVGF